MLWFFHENVLLQKFHDFFMHGIFLCQIPGFPGEWEPCSCWNYQQLKFLLNVRVRQQHQVGVCGRLTFLRPLSCTKYQACHIYSMSTTIILIVITGAQLQLSILCRQKSVLEWPQIMSSKTGSWGQILLSSKANSCVKSCHYNSILVSDHVIINQFWHQIMLL